MLRRLDACADAEDEREHINLHILRYPHRFKMVDKQIKGKLARPDIGMTIDTRDDWLRVKEIFDPRQTDPWNISLHEAIERMDTVAARPAAETLPVSR